MSGKIAWTDLTVADAQSIRDFYSNVVGWEPEAVRMGEYDDFNMVAPGSNEPSAGICHARGSNADLPPVWMIYITVDDLQKSLEECQRLGGKVLKPPRENSQYAVIEDPAGAICTLYQQ
ncbi:VOC family protein [Aliikangiella marina]|uniref:VOC family protein n=1 Tax=Aliikangiella marina TaxID=1712262 RepID=A0A545TEB6_9GAMM|nr:VOC family protein [Aliikangiella marina]TQV75567.1 VOC family protein [Aliikangiella marina]